MSLQTSVITLYLHRLKNGDASAEGALAEAVYERLVHMAKAAMQGRSSADSLQPTALANEVLLELVRIRDIDWQDRLHFYRVASRLLRRRLIDHIRITQADKRPQTGQRVPLNELLLPQAARFDEIFEVHSALEQLEKYDPDLAELIEMVYFGGFTIKSLAELRGVSEKTVDRHLELGRRWLRKKLGPVCPEGDDSSALSFDRR